GRWCKKNEERFVQTINSSKPQTTEAIERIWYNGNSRRSYHYDDSRYRALNLHSLWQGKGIEFRCFNGTNHAGKIKTYIQLCLAICNQALTQNAASYKKTQTTNDKYTFRTWLLRLGMIGDEFETARKFLLENLSGDTAFRYGRTRAAA
ncbi:MAG: amidoligase family protein, partial [Clostridia bacterium]|nr:amidoligase family protein [Clostridia bacterium]